MQKVVFIASLHRSGSTVLELILQNFPTVVGLGEIDSFLRNFDKRMDRYCDCGKKAPACDFWGPALTDMERVKGTDASEMYRLLLNSFQSRFGKETIAVDSSKTLSALEALQNVPELEIKVIFLVRDVRAWVTSQKKNSAGLKALGSNRYFLRWYNNNRRIEKYLKQTNTTYFQVGYEELILYPSIFLQRIADFLRVEKLDSAIGLKSSNGHSIGGNRMRNDPKKRGDIYYDNRWFYSHKYWLMQMLFFPQIMKYNKRVVYGNIDHPFSYLKG